MTAWVKEVPNLDLNELHFALRIAATHPGIREEQAIMFDRLADACWKEHCRRVARDRSRWIDRFRTMLSCFYTSNNE